MSLKIIISAPLTHGSYHEPERDLPKNQEDFKKKRVSTYPNTNNPYSNKSDSKNPVSTKSDSNSPVKLVL